MTDAVVASVTPITNLLFREPAEKSVMLVDGYGTSVSVTNSHLLIRDGLGRARRERRLSRSQRTVRRIVILGHTGHITLDAVRWCHDTGISLTTIDTDGRVLMTAGAAGRDDARLRRSQAAAANSDVGLNIAKAMLRAKIDGQATVASTHLTADSAAQVIAGLADQLIHADNLAAARAIEATAANAYFGAWSTNVSVQFASKDGDRVPDHWTYFAVRHSPINGSSPRTAADPINAMLNYSYALAESECQLALIALGLDPGLGIVHTDKKNRDSLALDLLEPLRPIADDHVLTLVDRRHFTTGDFHETRVGACKLLPPLTHDLADAIPSYAATAARLAEQVTHALARSVPGKIILTTPLSRANTANSQTRGTRSAGHKTDTTVKIRHTCQNCGTDLYGSARKLCPTCWPVARNAHMRQLGVARAKPKAAKATTEDLSGGITLQQYQEQLLPGLATVSLADIERATGLTNGSCSRVRSGQQIPHSRHWRVLAALSSAG